MVIRGIKLTGNQPAAVELTRRDHSTDNTTVRHCDRTCPINRLIKIPQSREQGREFLVSPRKLAVSIVTVSITPKMLAHERDLLVLLRASFFCPKFGFLFDVQGLVKRSKSPDCEKLKSTCDNLGAVYSSDVDGKQLHENILDCKMLVSTRATKNYRVLKSSRLSSNCFINNADDGKIYCNLRTIFQ